MNSQEIADDEIIDKEPNRDPSMIIASSSEKPRPAKEKFSLLELLKDFRALPAPVIRTLFKKIVIEVSKLHLQGNYHGDLSLENIYFDQGYEVTLSKQERFNESFLDGVCMDLICLGEILFAMCFGALPYVSFEDERYTAVVKGEWDLFWTINEETLNMEKRGLNLLKSGLKDLVSIFLAGKSKSKHDLLHLLNHEWMKGATLTTKQVQTLLDEVRKKMQKVF